MKDNTDTIEYEKWSIRAVNTRVYPPLYEFVVEKIETEKAKKYLKKCNATGHKKIECCRYYMTPGLRCTFSREKCTYAHGLDDLVPFVQPTTWKKTDNPCEFYHKEIFDGNPDAGPSSCPFGARCSKVHAISADEMRTGMFTLDQILDRCDHLYEKPRAQTRKTQKRDRHVRFPVPETRGRHVAGADWSFPRTGETTTRSPERSVSPYWDMSGSSASDKSSDSAVWSTAGPVTDFHFACDGADVTDAINTMWAPIDDVFHLPNAIVDLYRGKSPVV